MRIKEICLSLLLVCATLVIPGCAAAIVGVGAAGTVAYIKGDLEAEESKSINAVYAATKKAVNQLGLIVTEDNKDAMTAVIVSHDVEGKTITIKLKSATEKTTKLSIRVGLFGSKRKSALIYQKIHDNLR